MLRIFSFLDEATGRELLLPVTPSGYTWRFGNQVETVRLDQVGEVNYPGTANLCQTSIEALLPAQLYPFCAPGAVADPDYYLDVLQDWCRKGTILRFLVSGTRVNEQVILEEVTFGESDGTNDVTATITLRGWRRVETPVLSTQGGGAQTGRDDATGANSAHRYTVVSGDTLWGIAERFYGSGTEYRRIASANSDQIKNPNLIYPGQVLTIPARDDLPAEQPKGWGEQISDDTVSAWDPVTETWTLTLKEVTFPGG